MSQRKRRNRAYARFMKRHERAVMSQVRRCASRLSAIDPGCFDDLVQEGMVAIWVAADRLPSYRDPLRTMVLFATRRMRQWLGMNVTKIDREIARIQRDFLARHAPAKRVRVTLQRIEMGDYDDDFIWEAA